MIKINERIDPSKYKQLKQKGIIWIIQRMPLWE
jgi:hypothetical protein